MPVVPHCGGVGARLTGVHAREHEAQGGHGPVRRRHVDSVHAELHQRFAVDARQHLRQQEALQAAQHAVVDDGGGGVLAGRHHHATQLGGGGRQWEGFFLRGGKRTKDNKHERIQIINNHECHI